MPEGGDNFTFRERARLVKFNDGVVRGRDKADEEIRDDADRDAIAMELMRYRDQNGQDWADIIDVLTMHPDVRRRVAGVLGEIDGR
jgi:hypothetical protein